MRLYILSIIKASWKTLAFGPTMLVVLADGYIGSRRAHNVALNTFNINS